ncbi:DUF4010 domain-containing protein [Halosolutus halophilus]|uniref:DUF4010 domain-containing protein n=1 Tax=Halosolutus halophilus TaxID=1552990 RepID=UPI002234FA64|nr:DUF4010 domain-containing protein [Halosolutus halophilus]
MRNELAERIDRDDLDAAITFLALIVVLLVLPNENLDALFGVNPQRVWSVVVFVAGLSFFGYLLSRVVDPTTAIGVTAAVGGCVSPGLTITSLTEQVRRYPAFSRIYAFAAAIAVTMLFPRNLLVVGIVSPSLARSVALPFVAMAGVGGAVTGLLWIRIERHERPAGELETPFRLRSAFAIGAVVAGIVLVIETVQPSIPSDVTRLGLVLLTIAEQVVYVGVTRAAGARTIALAIGAILLGSASLGIALVLLL